jgi:hypothetical protein
LSAIISSSRAAGSSAKAPLEPKPRDLLVHLRDAARSAQVGLDHLGADRLFAAQLLRQRLEAIAAPRDQDQVVLVLGEQLGELEPQARRGPRNQRTGHRLDLHQR